MVNDLPATLAAYFAFRKYEAPTAAEALLWLFSEVGELAEAWLITHIDDGDDPAENVFWAMVRLGERAEGAVAARKNWVRNHQPKDTVDLAGESGDVLMMLHRFNAAEKLPDPQQCLIQKMAKKGFKNNGQKC